MTSLTATQILDSRGYPTVEVALTFGESTVVASSPSGASTGAHEAVERRDGGHPFSGRGVRDAVAAVNTDIAARLVGTAFDRLEDIDQAMKELDGTPGLGRLGANAVVAVSMAATRALAELHEVPLYRYLADLTGSAPTLPVPHFNVINGGAHAPGGLAFQEFMIAPVSAANEDHAVQIGAEIYHVLADEIRARYGVTGLGDEGGFAPPIDDPAEALTLLVNAISTAGYTPGHDQIAIAMDPAANGFLTPDGYRIGSRVLTREQLADYYVELVNAFPIRSIEDGFAETDPTGWQLLAERLGDRMQLVGDDLYVTDPARIRDGARNGYSNAALIKPNQIGTVTDTLAAIGAARSEGMACMISHRSGETLDTFIADLAVGTGVGQIKSGAPARGERIAKYNRLVAIETAAPATPYGLR
ncbi:enolase [Microbacterium oxydans]|nr:enolase [Microbacterium oxydans]